MATFNVTASDTGLALTESLAYGGAIRSEIGLTISDSLRVTKPLRSLSDIGLNLSDSLGQNVLSAVGLTLSDSLLRVVPRSLAATGVTVAESLVKVARKAVADPGITVTTALVARKNGANVSVNLTDVGLAVVSSLARNVSLTRPLTDGLNLTSGILIQVNGAPPNSCTSDFRRFLLDLDASPEYAAWCSAEPADCSTWTTYTAAILSGGAPSPPSMSTAFGGALVDAGVIALDGIVPCRAKPPPVTAPHAAFSFTVSGLTVAFRNLSTPGESGDYDSWLWDFGDGDTDTIDWSPYHTYAGAGTYLVTLTVVGSGGDGISSVRHPVTVSVASTAGIHIDTVIL